MALIEVKHLKKYFNTAGGILHAVDDVTLNIEKSTTLGIVGESGCGKSTLGRTIIRLLEPTSGEVCFKGENITSLSNKEFKHLRVGMQMIFQDPYASLDPRMSVSQLIAEPIQTYKLTSSKQELEKRVSDLMDTVGLAARLKNSYPHELDGGRRQRIGIARALSLNPDFIVCDEPVSALDVSIQAQVLNLLQDLQKERNLTYMFITHDMSVVKHISDEICVMYLGQVVEKCQAKELFKRPLHPYSKALLSAIPIPNIHVKQHKIEMKGELTSPIDPKPCCRFAPRCPYAKDQCFASEPQLTDCGNHHYVLCHRVNEI
ncbi:peptide/nickel transport system ATP-binding protein [Catenibacillus scindens]|uniref:Peptide/nickel transport system ATP-binding protein n=1 Tax=Catenibacillus scindens TaxID=673271 RepID=A0A7W8H9Z8_9FIRM|nr:oligopeptide/dipeptide ABC transporter ATP-binding protein [Catenibacillus scindens]MBB5264629.1 peptide/nickel transport system ATP-binding protein [Catenibacillus scindens]